MGKPTGFLEFPRRMPGYRPHEERVHDWRAVERLPLADDAREQAARCMDCGIPFCHGCGCPLANIIPEWNDLVYRGRWREALELLLLTNPFPEFTGRICPALCEGSCVLGINRDPVTIRCIELAIIERAFAEGWMKPQAPSERRAECVAVIGSGPAGLAVAQTLNRRGFAVTVFDAARRPGGILRYGIPEFKLEKNVVARRVSLMEAEGVRFENGVVVGEDVSLKFLRDRFDAICMAGGAREPRDLQVPGREQKGIHFAMDYLRQQNRRLDGEPIPASEEIWAGGKTYGRGRWRRYRIRLPRHGAAPGRGPMCCRSRSCPNRRRPVRPARLGRPGHCCGAIPAATKRAGPGVGASARRN